jgi:hypothetical protein
MFMNVQTEVLSLLPGNRKTSNKWISFNAPCCVYNGETEDRRKRGGVLPAADGSISYHCFNCGFKTSYKPGRALTYKFKKWLGWLGADDNTVQRLIVEALRAKDLVPAQDTQVAEKKQITFKPRSLPDPAMSFKEMLQDQDASVPQQLVDAVEYVANRGIDPLKYPFYVTNDTAYNLHRRLIIPFYWQGELIGYTARGLDDSIKPKYHSSYEPDYVFNIDNQSANRKFVIVVEGPFDAMAVDGVAILGSEVSDTQADIIDSLGREVIVVPDFDVHINTNTNKKVWSGRSMIEAALDYGWTVSFPVWLEKYKDVSEATQELGYLFVLKSIIAAKESNPLKIELISKQIYNKL